MVAISLHVHSSKVRSFSNQSLREFLNIAWALHRATFEWFLNSVKLTPMVIDLITIQTKTCNANILSMMSTICLQLRLIKKTIRFPLIKFKREMQDLASTFRRMPNRFGSNDFPEIWFIWSVPRKNEIFRNFSRIKTRVKVCVRFQGHVTTHLFIAFFRGPAAR